MKELTVLEAILQRKSVRAFLPKEVSTEIIKKILNYAKYAPSGSNTQPWNIAIVTGATKAKIDMKLTETFLNNIPPNPDYEYYPKITIPEFQQRRRMCGFLLYETLGIEKDNKKERIKQWALNYCAFHAPCVLFIFINKQCEKGSFIDCGMFIQNILLLSQAEGLATCPQAALAEYPDIIRNELGYSQNMQLLCGIALGYEDTKAKVNTYKTPREDLNNFARFFE